jgi:hypothetical protein
MFVILQPESRSIRDLLLAHKPMSASGDYVPSFDIMSCLILNRCAVTLARTEPTQLFTWMQYPASTCSRSRGQQEKSDNIEQWREWPYSTEPFVLVKHRFMCDRVHMSELHSQRRTQKCAENSRKCNVHNVTAALHSTPTRDCRCRQHWKAAGRRSKRKRRRVQATV